MGLSQTFKRKNSHTAWMLAVVLFFSGLSFSYPTAYNKDGRIKATTELVISSKKNSGRVTNTIPSKSFCPDQLAGSRYLSELHSCFSEIALKKVRETYFSFSSYLLNISFSNQQRVSITYLIS